GHRPGGHGGRRRHLLAGRRPQGLAQTAGAERQSARERKEEPERLHASIPNTFFAASIRFFTWAGAVPPWLVRLLTDASSESTLKTSASIRPSTARSSSRPSSQSFLPLSSASRTARPVMWCASRNGTFALRTSQSARSVAVVWPASAAARIRSALKVTVSTIPVLAPRL